MDSPSAASPGGQRVRQDQRIYGSHSRVSDLDYSKARDNIKGVAVNTRETPVPAPCRTQLYISGSSSRSMSVIQMGKRTCEPERTRHGQPSSSNSLPLIADCSAPETNHMDTRVTTMSSYGGTFTRGFLEACPPKGSSTPGSRTRFSAASSEPRLGPAGAFGFDATVSASHVPCIKEDPWRTREEKNPSEPKVSF